MSFIGSTCSVVVMLEGSVGSGFPTCLVPATEVTGTRSSDLMITIERVSEEPYAAGYGAVPLAQIANTERLLPDAFIGPDGRSITAAFRRYALPLLGDPLPPYGRLEMVPWAGG